MQITIVPKGLNEAISRLQGLKRQLPAVISQAINNTANKVQTELRNSMKTSFDRPTPFTLNSLFMKPSTPSTLTAFVAVKDPPRLSDKKHYLLPHIEGTTRAYKRSEGALYHAGVLPSGHATVPGSGARLDPYGNMSPGQIVQLISYFRGFGEQGYRANITDKKKAKMLKGSKRKIGTAYFVGKPGGGRLPLGIYQRFRLYGGTAIKPIMIFTKRKPAYKKRWPFVEIAQRVVDREFSKQLNDAVARALNVL